MLGGLITKDTSAIERKVPYLADIPLLGQLFRYNSMSAQRKELLIILTPYVIRGPEDSERIKQLETARMSWVCEDVHAIHGVTGLCDITHCPACAANVPVVYPDFDPHGVRINEPPGEAEPSPAELEQVPLLPPGESAPNAGPPPVYDNPARPPLPPQNPGPAPTPPPPAIRRVLFVRR